MESRADGAENRLMADAGPAEKAAKCRKITGVRLGEFDRQTAFSCRYRRHNVALQ